MKAYAALAIIAVAFALAPGASAQDREAPLAWATVPCAICHGPELKGLGPIPGIAGRSTNYIVRQLYDLKHGARAGVGSALMKPSVEKLTVDDMLVLAAYIASLAP